MKLARTTTVTEDLHGSSAQIRQGVLSLAKRPQDAVLWALFAIAGLVAAMFAPVPTLVVATVLALMGAGGHRWRWVALAVLAIACLVFMMLALAAAPIEQPVRVR